MRARVLVFFIPSSRTYAQLCHTTYTDDNSGGTAFNDRRIHREINDTSGTRRRRGVSKDVRSRTKMIFILFLRVIVYRASEIWSLQRRNAFPCNLDRDLLSTFDSRRSKLFSRNRPQFPNFLFQRRRLTVTTTPIFARRSFKNTKKERRESTHICNSFSLIIHTSFFAT